MPLQGASVHHGQPRAAFQLTLGKCRFLETRKPSPVSIFQAQRRKPKTLASFRNWALPLQVGSFPQRFILLVGTRRSREESRPNYKLSPSRVRGTSRRRCAAANWIGSTGPRGKPALESTIAGRGSKRRRNSSQVGPRRRPAPPHLMKSAFRKAGEPPPNLPGNVSAPPPLYRLPGRLP